MSTAVQHHALRRSQPTSGTRRFTGLLGALVVREIKGQYRRSLLGPAWALLQPVLYLTIFLFIRSFVSIPSDGTPYAVFAFSALVPWTFFSNAVTRCAPSVFVNRGIVKKIAVRAEVFPAAAVLVSLMDLLIASLLLVGMLAWYDIAPTWQLLWLVPLLALAAVLALGLGLVASALGTYRQDVMFGIPFLLQLWMLATPVMYPASEVPERWLLLVRLNPMAGVIDGFRNVLLHGTAPDPGLLAGSAASTLLVWLVAWPTFRYLSRYFADVL